MAVSVPNSFIDGGVIEAADFNANFTSLVNYINGSIDQTSFTTLSGLVSWSISSNVNAISIANSGTEGSLLLSHTGVLASAKSAIRASSSGAQTTGDSLVYFGLTNASSSIPAVLVDQRGTGDIIRGVSNTTVNFRVASDGSFAKGILYQSAGKVYNLSLIQHTTSNSNDSIRITSARSDALSTDLPGYVSIPDHTTPGRVLIKPVTSVVTFPLDDVDFGFDTLGDIPNIPLTVYAINDNNTLKWGVALLKNATSITTAKSSATAADIDAQDKMLVSSTLSGTSACVPVGYALANWDDTNNRYSVSSTLVMGSRAPSSTRWTSFTPTGSWSSNTTYTGQYRLVGDALECQVKIATSNTPTSADLTVNLPNGFVIDTSKLVQPVSLTSVIGNGLVAESGVDTFPVHVNYNNTSSVIFSVFNAAATVARYTTVTQAAPMTWGADDFLTASFSVPVRGHEA